MERKAFNVFDVCKYNISKLYYTLDSVLICGNLKLNILAIESACKRDCDSVKEEVVK